jgi:hypothetical protein
MAIFHRATITPSKAELIAEWAPTQPWGPPARDPVLRNDRFELTAYRRPAPGPPPTIGLTATWDGQDGAVVLAGVRER